jgi:6-phosphogluconolactonase
MSAMSTILEKPTVERHDFADAGALAHALSAKVAALLSSGIRHRGHATLAVSGGSTPKRFFAELSQADIDWMHVTVTLVDERWVDGTSDRSNARLVHDLLLQNRAAAARFVPLWSGGDVPDHDAIAKTNSALGAVAMPLDVVILGMGNDGHTASFFPGGDTLDIALTDEGPAVALHAPGAGEPRVTLTLPALLNTKALFLHIEGAEKAQTLAKAMQAGAISEMPVRAVLRQSRTPVSIYHCP